MQLSDGKAISELVKQEIAAEVAGIVAKGGKRPHLAATYVSLPPSCPTRIAAKWGDVYKRQDIWRFFISNGSFRFIKTLNINYVWLSNQMLVWLIIRHLFR